MIYHPNLLFSQNGDLVQFVNLSLGKERIKGLHGTCLTGLVEYKLLVSRGRFLVVLHEKECCL